MEKEQRDALRSSVVKARRILEREFQEQLEGAYNILPDGHIIETAPGDPVVRARLLDVIEHHRACGATSAEAVERTRREAAFTVLNRFAALKMAERRGLVRKCVSDGLQSEGVRELAECAPGLRAAVDDGGYRLLVEAVTDEISIDLKVLFDRRDAMAPLWPRPKALDELLETLNGPQLSDCWSEDETIGWVYQYFNADDVKEMRDSSTAPRDSHELAVRNQFFTPRYVVQFLVENTLGRLWYEMCQGDTVLRDRCKTLVCTPRDVFLKSGESPPQEHRAESSEGGGDVTYIPHREFCDPRELRVLDPAVGSGHFLLYAFDLLEAIYHEAWSLGGAADSRATCRTLRLDYPTESELSTAIPGLILRHNLYGIEIDARAAQIAALALWLRAQRSYRDQELAQKDRPAIDRANIVVAEPMPGEPELLERFVSQLQPAPLRDLVRRIWREMQLAGEAGSLLRIEEHISSAVEEAAAAAGPLFTADESGFWPRAEESLRDALQLLALEASAMSVDRRRLFAEDAAQGIAFIDVARQYYDVVLMNPPFGAASEASKEYVFAQFGREKIDLGPCFISRFVERLKPGVRLGAIVNRTSWFLNSFSDWRRERLFKSSSMREAIDLGDGVLDGAVVDTYATTIERDSQSDECVVMNALAAKDKASAVLECVSAIRAGEPNASTYSHKIAHLGAFASRGCCYWVSDSLLDKIDSLESASSFGLIARSGLQTCDNFRFLRLWFEMPPSFDSAEFPWLTKGGEYQPFFTDLHLVLNYSKDGHELKAFVEALHGQWSRCIQSPELYFLPGGTYTVRTASSLSMRVLPAGCTFDKQGPVVASDDVEFLLAVIALSYCRTMRLMVEMEVGLRDATESGGPARSFLPSVIEGLGTPQAVEDSKASLARLARQALSLHRRRFLHEESSPLFRPLRIEGQGVHRLAQEKLRQQAIEDRQLAAIDRELEAQSIALFSLSEADTDALDGIVAPAWPVPGSAEIDQDELRELIELDIDSLVDLVAAKRGNRKRIIRKQYFSSRRNELLADYFDASPEDTAEAIENSGLCPEWLVAECARSIVSMLFGLALRRWDLEVVLGHRRVGDSFEPFDAVRPHPPGYASGPYVPFLVHGSRRESAVSETSVMAEVLRIAEEIWADDAPSVLADLSRAVGSRDLAQYFERAGGFFSDHLAVYTKSRRRAPVYWPLSTSSGSYTVWIFYHCLTADTLFEVANECLEPELRKVQEDRLQAEAGMDRVKGRDNAKLARQVGELAELEEELAEMKAELLRVAELPYKPDLNDGVQITAAPLWKLFRLPKWRKDVEATWKKLEKGEYDWSHLAYAIWPDRVREKCKTDRSLAIAHGLEGLCEGESAPKKKRRKKSSA